MQAVLPVVLQPMGPGAPAGRPAEPAPQLVEREAPRVAPPRVVTVPRQDAGPVLLEAREVGPVAVECRRRWTS
jgi:hypothetical protein